VHLLYFSSFNLVLCIFGIGAQELFAQGWLWTMILLTSASWVAGITGVGHHARLVIFLFLLQIFSIKKGLLWRPMPSKPSVEARRRGKAIYYMTKWCEIFKQTLYRTGIWIEDIKNGVPRWKWDFKHFLTMCWGDGTEWRKGHFPPNRVPETGSLRPVSLCNRESTGKSVATHSILSKSWGPPEQSG
jgi:hypothetical protein